MSEATIRALIKTSLKSISNIGEVHDYERWAADYTKLLDFFKTTISGEEVIRGWTITCEGWPGREKSALPRGTKARTYEYKIRGYLTLNDGDKTEITAMALAETVCDTFDEDATLHPAGSGFGANISTLDVFEPRLFGGILLHYIEIGQPVTEYLKA